MKFAHNRKTRQALAIYKAKNPGAANFHLQFELNHLERTLNPLDQIDLVTLTQLNKKYPVISFTL